MQGARNVFLVGMMGAGKTTAGRLLARRLKRTFLDSDQEVERRCGVKVPIIFEIEGEAGFRQREAAVIAELTALEDVVLATGGGAILAPESRRHLAARGTVVYLHALPEALYERVRQDKNRPLLATDDPRARLAGLYAERDPLYREIADIVLDTGRQSVQTLARALLARLKESWKLSA
jgi:shikimate kinase